MELYLLRPAEFQLRYNCSFYSVEDVPLAARQHPKFGWTLIALFAVFEGLYLPCVAVLWRQRHQSSCYKFMLYIGVVDLICMPINTLLTGIFAIQGAVYCTYPTLILITGAIGDMLWFAESAAAVFLALNRCVELASPYWGAVLYEDSRAWWWLLLPTGYALISSFFMKPIVYSSIFVAWFFNPHIGYFDDVDGTYSNINHAVHNVVITFLLPGFYAAFALLLMKKGSAAGGEIPTDERTSASQRIAFIQVALISVINAMGAGIYVYMQFFPSTITVEVIHCATFLWIFISGAPALVYLALNRTIRRESLLMVEPLFRCLGMGSILNRYLGPAQVNPMAGRTVGNQQPHQLASMSKHTTNRHQRTNPNAVSQMM